MARARLPLDQPTCIENDDHNGIEISALNLIIEAVLSDKLMEDS